jgi:hypothetical protein
MNSGPVPGWYPDPRDPRQRRFWDGTRWTDHLAPRPEGDLSATTPSLAMGPAAVQDVRTWLWQSIVATLLCCVPFGIVAIVYAAQANAAKGVGDLATARVKAGKARTWVLWAVILGLLVGGALFWLEMSDLDW